MDQRTVSQARFTYRSKTAVLAIRVPLSLMAAFAAWWLLVFALSTAVSVLGFQSVPGSFLATLLVWISPLGAGWLVLVVLFLAFLLLSRRIVGTAVDPKHSSSLHHAT